MTPIKDLILGVCDGTIKGRIDRFGDSYKLSTDEYVGVVTKQIKEMVREQKITVDQIASVGL